ncbi:hypothetical protein K7X08_002663 [Anisodus acutangulus]|uniref:Uncharacterized protein n=1 Tax=Anisodus acutangulus TaxID=402998 RepID=A0A9Q1LPV7_9SOLA|nr:hypothetical protein K7X08_002663 [Anisodus acutangulus]
MVVGDASWVWYIFRCGDDAGLDGGSSDTEAGRGVEVVSMVGDWDESDALVVMAGVAGGSRPTADGGMTVCGGCDTAERLPIVANGVVPVGLVADDD